MKKVLFILALCLPAFTAVADTVWKVNLINDTQLDLSFNLDTNTCSLNQDDSNQNSLCTTWVTTLPTLTLPPQSAQTVILTSDGNDQQMLPILVSVVDPSTGSSNQTMQFELWEGSYPSYLPRALYYTQLGDSCGGFSDSTTIGISTNNLQNIVAFGAITTSGNCNEAVDGALYINIAFGGLTPQAAPPANTWQQVASMATAPSGLMAQNYYPYSPGNTANPNQVTSSAISDSGNILLGTTSGSVLLYNANCISYSGLNNCISIQQFNNLQVTPVYNNPIVPLYNEISNVIGRNDNLTYNFGSNGSENSASYNGSGSTPMSLGLPGPGSWLGAALLDSSSLFLGINTLTKVYPYTGGLGVPSLWNEKSELTSPNLISTYSNITNLTAANALALDSLGNIWQVSGNFLLLYPQGNFAATVLVGNSSTFAGSNPYKAIAADNAAGVYVAGPSTSLNGQTCDLGYYSTNFSSNTIPYFDICGNLAPQLANENIVALVWDSFDQSLFIATGNNVVKFNPEQLSQASNSWVVTTPAPIFSLNNGDNIFSLLSDGKGNIYAITTAGSIWHLSDN